MGFNIIFNSTGIINFAQGEFAMFGGLFAYTFSAVLGFKAIGFLFWRKEAYKVPEFTSGNLSLPRVTVSQQFLWVLGLTALSVVLVYLFFNKTRAGKAMRACSINRQAASLVGINVSRMSLYSFTLAAALGALAGLINAPFASYSIGLFLGIKGFTAAVIGGLGNTFGAVTGGLVLGLSEELITGLLTIIVGVSTGYKDAVAAALLIGILLWRPQGLLDRGVAEKV
jgi:branched-chain amino acid transport system permease protein